MEHVMENDEQQMQGLLEENEKVFKEILKISVPLFLAQVIELEKSMNELVRFSSSYFAQATPEYIRKRSLNLLSPPYKKLMLFPVN